MEANFIKTVQKITDIIPLLVARKQSRFDHAVHLNKEMLKPASHIEEAYNLNILPPKDILVVQSGTIHNPPCPQKKNKEKKIDIIWKRSRSY